MSKPILACLLLAFAFSAAAVAAEAPPVPAPAADPAAATLLAAPTAGPTCAAAATPAVPDTTPVWMEKSCCISRCRRDQDCTAFCGGPGQCVQVNSCCRECFCFQI